MGFHRQHSQAIRWPGNAEQMLAGYDGELSVKHTGRERLTLNKWSKDRTRCRYVSCVEKIYAYERVDQPDRAEPLR